MTRAERMKKPHSSVRYSVIAPGARSPSGGLAVILAPAANRLKAGTRRSKLSQQRVKHALRFAAVVGCVIADVDVDGDESRFGPCVNGEMRLGEKNGAGDALRLELEEAFADDGEARVFNRPETDVAQCVCARE